MEIAQDTPPGAGRRIEGEAPAEGELSYWEVCPVCGQAFDKRDLVQVLRHVEAEHDPQPRS